MNFVSFMHPGVMFSKNNERKILMLKKALAFFLCFVMAVSLLEGCSDMDSQAINPTASDTKPVEETTKKGDTDTNPDRTEPDENNLVSNEEYPFEMDFEFEEQVVYENDEVKVTVVDLYFDEADGLHFQYKIEDTLNRSLFLDYNSLQGPIINNCLIYPTMDYVERDETVVSELIRKKDLAFFQVADVYSFKVSDVTVEISEDQTFKTIAGPFDIDLEIKNDKEQPEIQIEGELLYDKDGVQLYFLFGHFGTWEAAPVLYLKNDSEKEVCVSIDNIRQDGESLEKLHHFFCYSYPFVNHASALGELVERVSDGDYSNVKTVVVDIKVQSPDGTVYGTITDYKIDWQKCKRDCYCK